MSLPSQVQLQLPEWVAAQVTDAHRFEDDASKVRLAIELAAGNVRHGTGGPFGAAIFEGDQLIAVGVNRVVPAQCSVAHAEMLAFMLAQQQLQRFRLNQAARAPITLATSAQPCCQCYGAAVWAGIDRLLIGARAEDVEQLAGFDEGPLPTAWAEQLQQRGIEVQVDLLRSDARQVLARYAEQGPLY